MNVLLIILIAIFSLFLLMSIFALIKKPSSVYKNKSEEWNPMEGKKVVFIKDEKEKENADGVRGYLKSVGEANHKEGFYERIIKRAVDIILSFAGLVFLSPIFLFLSLWIVIDDPGPIFFTQKRIGKNKQYFQEHKGLTAYKSLENKELKVA